MDAVAGTEFGQLQLQLQLQLQAKQIDADERMRTHQSDHCVTVTSMTPDETRTCNYEQGKQGIPKSIAERHLFFWTAPAKTISPAQSKKRMTWRNDQLQTGASAVPQRSDGRRDD